METKEEKGSSEAKGEDKMSENLTTLDYSDRDTRRVRKWLTFSKSNLVLGFERMNHFGNI